jgi:FlaA1/EpsC-like NDP-sugar epimerase
MSKDHDAPRVPSPYAPAMRHAYLAGVHLLLFIFSLWVAYGLRYEFRVPPAANPGPDEIRVVSVDFTPPSPPPPGVRFVKPGDPPLKRTGPDADRDLMNVPASVWGGFTSLLAFVLLVKLLVFGYFRLYAGWWQYFSIQDLIETFKASHISTAIILAGVYSCRALKAYGVISADVPVPDTILIIDWAATIALAGGMRFLVRILREGSRPVSPAGLTRVLIVGADDAGEGVLRELYRLPVEKYHVVAFVDDDARKRGIRIHGVPVLGGVADLASVAQDHKIDEVVIALAQPTRDELRRIIEVCKGQRLTFRIVPGVVDLIEGRTDITRLREVDINDLLGRDPVSLDSEGIGQFVSDKVVLVTGAGGSIGSELCRQLVAFKPRRLILLDQAENNLFFLDRELRTAHPGLNCMPVIADVCDLKRLDDVFRNLAPHVVFHAAAHKHVPMMELNPGEAIKNNIFGSKNVIDMACKHKAEAFVMISTDKAVNPTSVMGCTKRITEMYATSLSASQPCRGTKLVIVRFGNVLGSAGSVVPIFREQIAHGGPVRVTHPEMQRYFMTIPEATQLVIQAGAMGKSGETMLLDMGTPVKIVDLARDMITLSGFRPDIDIKIEFEGMRPGEKLFEELRTTGENVLPTHHHKIFIWQSRYCTIEDLKAALASLAKVTDGATPTEVREALRSVVPEYQPMADGAATIASAPEGPAAAPPSAS